LDFRFKGLIQQAPNRRVVAFHRAFDYLARDYGLEIVAVIENDPGVEPSARDLAALARQIKAAAPVAIFAEPQYPARVAQTLSTETGVPLYVLNPLETGPADPDAYINAMWENLKTLGTALLLNRKE
jgi:zinc transport system substrate-binding protein